MNIDTDIDEYVDLGVKIDIGIDVDIWLNSEKISGVGIR